MITDWSQQTHFCETLLIWIHTLQSFATPTDSLGEGVGQERKLVKQYYAALDPTTAAFFSLEHHRFLQFGFSCLTFPYCYVQHRDVNDEHREFR